MNTWFRFDLSALQDERMVVLRKRHGFEGVGVYFMLVIECFKNDGTLPAEKIPVLFEAYDVQNGDEILSTIVNVCLLRKKGEGYVSDRVLKEIAISKENMERRKLAGQKGGAASALSRKQAIPEAIVKQSSTIVNDAQPHNITLHNKTLKSLGEKNDEKPTRTERPDAEVLQTFFDMAENERWSERTYTEAKTKQFYELSKEDKVDVLKKMRVANNAFFSKSESTKKLSKKIYYETVGLIQDRALDRNTNDGKTIAKRREFSDDNLEAF